MYLSISIECDLYLRNVFYSSQSITEVCEKDPVLGGASAGLGFIQSQKLVS